MHKNNVRVFKWIGMVLPPFLAAIESVDRLHDISAERTINPWVHFLFPGRGNARSTQKWEWFHFTGVDQYVPFSSV